MRGQRREDGRGGGAEGAAAEGRDDRDESGRYRHCRFGAQVASGAVARLADHDQEGLLQE